MQEAAIKLFVGEGGEQSKQRAVCDEIRREINSAISS
jgi:hypothetical protein